MIKLIAEIPGADSLKAKRRVVLSIKDKMRRRFHISAAEVDLHDALAFTEIGGALVSNSAAFGEAVLQKAFEAIESESPIRVQDVRIHSEEF